MKCSITIDNFPMLLVDMMVEDLRKYLPVVDIQVGGESTVFVTFTTDDVVKAQEGIIILDKYRYGGSDDGCKILCQDGE